MPNDDPHALGYRDVDDDPHVAVLLSTMDDTAAWAATRRLRQWERVRLQLRPGQRLLDVGCGLGDAAIALADDLGPTGALVAVDASAEMIAGARRRASAAEGAVRFDVGDAVALAAPDGAFDVVRSERLLQWVPEAERAVVEMARVVRPGGLVSLIDTDWSTFDLQVGDESVSRMVRDGMRVERHRPSNIGRRLADVARGAGLGPLAETTATQTWTEWDPDSEASPAGCFSMASLADDLVERGQLRSADREAFVSTVHDAARQGHFSMSLTMFAVVASAPRRTGR